MTNNEAASVAQLTGDALAQELAGIMRVVLGRRLAENEWQIVRRECATLCAVLALPAPPAAPVQGDALTDDSVVRAMLSEALACIGNLPDGPSDYRRHALIKGQIRGFLALRAAPQSEPQQGIPSENLDSEQQFNRWAVAEIRHIPLTSAGERQSFEAFAVAYGADIARHGSHDGSAYVDDYVDDMWDAWQARSLLAAPAAPATGGSGPEFSAGMAHAAEICDRRETEAWADYERTKSKHAKGEADGLVNAAHAIRAEIAATPPAAKSEAASQPGEMGAGANTPEDGHAAANCDVTKCAICAKNYPDIVASAQQEMGAGVRRTHSERDGTVRASLRASAQQDEREAD